MIVRVFSLLLVIALGVELAQAKPLPSRWQQLWQTERLSTKLRQGLAEFTQGSKKTLAATLTAATLMLSSPVVEAQNWQRVTARSAEHLKSSFYLVLDAGDLWRIMHIEYLGLNEDDEPLFVGLRAFTVMRDGDVEHNILDQVEASLVGYDGLIQQGVAVEIEKVFPHPERRFLDLVMLTLTEIDMSEYLPIKVELWPMKMLTELEMLSYRADLADNKLGFFAYQPMRRSCVAGSFFVKQGVAMHSCVVPHNPASIASPIFSKQSGALVALHVGYDTDGLPYAAPAPPALVSISNATLAVSAEQKTATLWGKIKSAQ